jgi:hypothetical protein
MPVLAADSIDKWITRDWRELDDLRKNSKECLEIEDEQRSRGDSRNWFVLSGI